MKPLMVTRNIFCYLIIAWFGLFSGGVFADLNLSQKVIDEDPLWIAKVNSSYNRKTTLSADHETRVMFDEDIAWALSKSNTDKIINDVAAAGFNVYVPCVWHGGGSYFFSDYTYLNARLRKRKLIGDDPLEYLIKRAHEHNIEVHAWFTVVFKEEDRYKEYFDEGTPAYAFNVHDPVFRKFIINLMNDAINRYDLDGVNLDYIRSMGFCRSKSCVDDYYNKTHRKLEDDLLVEKVSTKKIASSAQISLRNWNLSVVEEIVRSVSNFKNERKPSLLLSADSHPRNYEVLMQGQDTLGWLARGLIDHIFYMEYDAEIDYRLMDEVIFGSGLGKKITPLNAFYDLPTLKKKSGDLLVRSIAAEKRMWPDSGIAFYHYKEMTKDQMIKLKQGPFAASACPVWRDCKK